MLLDGRYYKIITNDRLSNPGKMVISSKYKKDQIQSILDSDYEYPDVSSDELEEGVDRPAYLLDDRFSKINFNSKTKEINNSSVKDEHNHSIVILEDLQRNLFLKTFKYNRNQPVLIGNCLLTKQDCLCLRLVEPSVSDAVFMWFVSYLNRKNLQKSFGEHLVSCLVTEVQLSLYDKTEKTPFKKLHKFTLI